jgi:hypothetical protein
VDNIARVNGFACFKVNDVLRYCYDQKHIHDGDIGSIFAVGEVRNVMSGDSRLVISNDQIDIDEGFPSMTSPKRCQTGWKGTNNDNVFFGLGAVKLIKFKQHPNTCRTVLVFERID